ncbi:MULTISPECIES: photosynthesis system II assembly factor Ycf48 [unclassified Nostoc]|uniref:photosynthesis system II assembly factor Ycf48 n=1 Tax=unclassified Nostoc TaxID=2593658 RepID=UPI0025AB04EF|nr:MULTISPECIES: photosynthesis system II assembly factor Ycf48 [unclassified Nostoc]MDM9585937.1 photosynthesis system II assembly factor Ycf48 [Nostoc sp. GT001]MDZ7945511.1 photosynthesis system II assembly factor Ycf48 [Nostoc sp. EfeVER01]MDZ7994447.1 photosynthesis system II assembly factor Ycf48 [Nostoc sp. EspVER01]
MHSIVKGWQRIFALLIVVVMCIGCSQVPSVSYNPWKVISVPTDSNLLDIAFTDNLEHGYLVGSNATLLETNDGGNTWKPITLQLDEQKYRFDSVSFAGKEGWIAGEPGLLLHTTDEGASWSRIPLSEKLPGSPIAVKALADNTAEMATNVGAIYKTTDGGKNWKAQVESAVGVVRNLERSADGKYIAVSAKGSFYSTWEPGQDAWVPHNRNSSRRLENMGFTENGQLWLLARGGQVQFSDPTKPEEWQKAQYPELSTSWGLLDLAYRTPNEIWVGGGSGNLLRSADGGKTWEKDRDIEEVAANLYKIVFLEPERGFIIGDRGVLLKYLPNPETTSPEAA